jgi:hypothetical protein
VPLLQEKTASFLFATFGGELKLIVLALEPLKVLHSNTGWLFNHTGTPDI